MSTQEEFLKSQKRILWLAYLLNLLLAPALVGFVIDLTSLYVLLIPAILGFVLSISKLFQYRRMPNDSYAAMADDVNIYWGHHLWLFRTFIITIVLSMAALGTVYYGYGYVIAAGAIVWWIYRMVRGIASLFSFHTVPVWR